MNQERELELLRKIEALVLERERLRAVLKEIAELWGSPNDDAEPARDLARNALFRSQQYDASPSPNDCPTPSIRGVP